MVNSGFEFKVAALKAFAVFTTFGALTFTVAPKAHAGCKVPCGLDQAAAYPHLIVGVVQSVATDEQSETLYTKVKAVGHWAHLPASAQAYKAALQPVTIRLPARDGDVVRDYTVLISQTEARVLHLQPGDFVRYSPHFGAHEVAPTNPDERAYWSVSGCIATLCVVSDIACLQDYRHGVFDVGTGQARSADGSQAAPDAPGIDPLTMRAR